MAPDPLISKIQKKLRLRTQSPRRFLKCRALHWILGFTLFVNAGCIHLPPAETKTVAPETSGPFTLNENRQYRIESMAYKREKYPLDDFLRRLKKGEFVEAFKAIHLNYQPSNTQNQALKELIEAGYTPVFVRFTNKTESEMNFDESYFKLIAENQRYSALSVKTLPREFSHFSFQSTVANVYNVTVVVVATLVLFAALGALRASPQGNWDGLFSDFSDGGRHSQQSSNILNDVTIETKIDYRNHLIKKTVLGPGETTQGLLFFRTNSADLTESWIEIQP